VKGDDAFSRKAERFTVAYQWARRTRTCTATAISSRPYLFPSTPSAARAGRWPRDTDVWGRVAPRAAADGPRSRCGATCQSDEPAIKIPAPTCLLPPLLACSTTTPLSRSASASASDLRTRRRAGPTGKTPSQPPSRRRRLRPQLARAAVIKSPVLPSPLASPPDLLSTESPPRGARPAAAEPSAATDAARYPRVILTPSQFKW